MGWLWIIVFIFILGFVLLAIARSETRLKELADEQRKILKDIKDKRNAKK